MRVMCVGKRSVEGVTEEGKSYNYCVAHLEYQLKTVDGIAVEQVRLYNNIIQPSAVKVDEYYNLERDASGRIIEFSPSK